MRKESILALIFFIFLLSAFFVWAEPLPFSGNDSQNIHDLERTAEFGEKISDETTREAYLRQEWGILLQNSSFGRGVSRTSEVLENFNFLFKIFLNIDYSLSWAFFFTLFLWIAVVIFVYEPIKDLLGAKRWIAFLISLLVASLIAQAQGYVLALSFLSFFLQSAVYAVSTFFVLLCIVILYKQIMKKIGKDLQARKKKSDEERRELKAHTVEKIDDTRLK